MLGANDGIISVSSLVVGVAASGASTMGVLLTGVAGLIAGAMSMAAGEYVSVQSQADTERADIEREKRELATEPEKELVELTEIYVNRGLDRPLARQVAVKLMSGDALAAHARDELGITETLRARPVQAAFASAASFLCGGILPIAAVMLSPQSQVTVILTVITMITLAVLGATAARIGGASAVRGAIRVVFWGALAMGATAAVGSLFGATA